MDMIMIWIWIVKEEEEGGVEDRILDYDSRRSRAINSSSRHFTGNLIYCKGGTLIAFSLSP
jgi:hypothetical protein